MYDNIEYFLNLSYNDVEAITIFYLGNRITQSDIKTINKLPQKSSHWTSN